MKKLNNLPVMKKINTSGLLTKAEKISGNLAKASGIVASIALSCIVIKFSLGVIKDCVYKPLNKKLHKTKQMTIIAVNHTPQEVEKKDEEKPGDGETWEFPNEQIKVKKKK